ncbi:hypothetical protein ZIOFF_036775 [Zingiber officinale]|uniref:Uncharacterized protein n=1 Tax=Zingiber officinale TaxID=94328 RepID=A0A8J5GJ22_ZINOF|nr:hypothetical protein ZIOFF_036775 [Zingiber officinale]
MKGGTRENQLDSLVLCRWLPGYLRPRRRCTRSPCAAAPPALGLLRLPGGPEVDLAGHRGEGGRVVRLFCQVDDSRNVWTQRGKESPQGKKSFKTKSKKRKERRWKIRKFTKRMKQNKKAERPHNATMARGRVVPLVVSRELRQPLVAHR